MDNTINHAANESIRKEFGNLLDKACAEVDNGNFDSALNCLDKSAQILSRYPEDKQKKS